MDSARHLIGSHFTKQTRVQNAFDDVASAIHQSLGGGVIDLSVAPRGVWKAVSLDVTDVIKAAIDGGSGDGGDGEASEFVNVTFSVAPDPAAPCESRALLEGNAGWVPPPR